MNDILQQIFLENSDSAAFWCGYLSSVIRDRTNGQAVNLERALETYDRYSFLGHRAASNLNKVEATTA
jgi:hypothetical protein